MVKVSAARSDARRFLIGESVKMAQQADSSPEARREWLRDRLMMWMDPAHAGGTGLLVGGGLTLGEALRGEKNFTRRLAQTALGAGAMYGGYKALTDPTWQRNINDYSHKAYDGTRAYVMDLVNRIRGT